MSPKRKSVQKGK